MLFSGMFSQHVVVLPELTEIPGAKDPFYIRQIQCAVNQSIAPQVNRFAGSEPIHICVGLQESYVIHYIEGNTS